MSGNKFVEKIERHKPPAIVLPFQYDENGLEFIEFIIKPLEIPHAKIIKSSREREYTSYVMDFIEGVNCADEPKAEYLYAAAEKAGEIYYLSKMNMTRVDKSIAEKYTLTKEKVIDYIKIINTCFHLPAMDLIVEHIFQKYQKHFMFVNHHDMQFRNFISNDDLHIIDWGGYIHPFFSDLYQLIQQADEVNADSDEIKRRYLTFSKIKAVSDEDIAIGGIIYGIVAVFRLLAFGCPIDWAKESYNELQKLVLLWNTRV